MMNGKLTGCLQKVSRALSLPLFALLTMTGAQAQFSTILQEIGDVDINNPRFQYYPFTYGSKGSSLWGPGVPGTQSIDFSLPLASPTWTEKLGYFFNPCFIADCTFGAGFEAGVSANTRATFRARADLGSVDLDCPGGVGITYPKQRDIVPGKPFTVTTYCYVEPTAYMNINSTHLGLKIGGKIDAKLDFALIAEAFGSKFVDINLFNLLGLPTPSISGEHELMDTGNLVSGIKDIQLPIPPNIGSGYFHVPSLGARGVLRNDKLTARAADNFLTFRASITNLLLQYTAFGIPIPLENDYDLGGFDLHTHLLDLQLQAAAGIRQDFTFDPRPLIQFRVVGGTTRTIRAGESITFTAPPATGTLRIIPTILYDQNSFSDKTSLTVDPTLSFDLIKIRGGGRVAGHNLFSFDLNPFGTQTVEDSFALPLFDQSFALPSPGQFVCPQFRIYATAINLNEYTGVALSINTDNPDGSATIKGILSTAYFVNSFTLHLEGERGGIDQVVNRDDDGSFTATIPNVAQLGQYRPLVLSGLYNALQTDFPINPITLYWSRPAIPANTFGEIAYDPNRVPNGVLVTSAGTGPFTLPLHSFNVEPNATLLYDDIPLPTFFERVAQIADGYRITGEIPDYLLDRGGVHTLSFRNSGINQKAVLIKTVTVNNAVPTVTDALKKRSTTDNSPLLLVRGTGFTLDTSVKIGGQSRPVVRIAPTELRVPLLDVDCTEGVHPVVVSNPAPGGGEVATFYEVAPVPADIPSLVARHSLLRHEPSLTNDPKGDTVADLITLTNAGKNVLRDVVVTSVKLLIGGKTFVASGGSQTVPLLRPGNYSSVQVILPPHSSVAGDVGILQVRGTVHGKSFVLSNRVTFPAFDL
ncbi:MAG: hypothetical protein H7308_07580 [Chthonomonadaceae bacterium]|nr:hypothetical protein [Chthonomonadaceae bacterium]